MKKLLLSAATVSILAVFVQANPSADYGEALKAKAQDNYASAAALFKSACYEGGNDSACKELGKIYESSRGSQVSKNTTLANEAYNKCCDLDSSRSDCCSAVGREAKPRRVLKAPERPKDSEELVTAAKECQEGSAEQCEKAFGLYQEDRHSEKFKASSKGCELGSAVLCEEAGLAYVRGHGVQQDQGTAAQFFLKACNANNVSACARIGVMTRDMGNVDAAAEILEQACQTLPRACRDLAMIYQNDSYGRKDAGIISAAPDFSRWASKLI